MDNHEIIGEDINNNSVVINMTNLKWRISVYGVLKKNKKVLFVKSSYSDRLSLPGGEVEISETREDALKREFLEETGLIIKPLQLLSIQEGYFQAPRGDNYHTLRFYYEVEKISGEITNTDSHIQKVLWQDRSLLMNDFPFLVNKE